MRIPNLTRSTANRVRRQRPGCLLRVGGKQLYGDLDRKPKGAAAAQCEQLSVCGRPKFLCVAQDTSASKLDQKVSEIEALLQKALLDVDALTTADGWNFAPLAPLFHCPK